jgi:hypothetical protein
MNSPISQYRTVVSPLSQANALRIPAIQAKRIIKLESSQIPAIMSNSINETLTSTQQPALAVQQNVSAAPVTATDDAPLLLGQTCGLFDLNIDSKFEFGPNDLRIFSSFENLNNEIFEGMLNESDPNIVYNLEPPQFFTSNSAEGSESQPPATTEPPKTPKSKFAQKISDVSDLFFGFEDFLIPDEIFSDLDSDLSQMNLKIQVPPRQLQSIELNSADKNLLSMDFLNDPEVNKLITPKTERMCMKLLHYLPTNSNQPSTRIITNDQITQIFAENDLAKLVDEQMSTTQNPFVSEMSANLSLNAPGKLATAEAPKNNENVNLDHGYFARQAGKRKLSELDEDNSMSCENSQDSFASSLTVSKSGESKKKRTRGIYRADDVTNEEEYKNYLERRKKNNISSKVSRANKKQMLNQMDVKADQLEKRNEDLKEKSKKLQEMIEIVKKELFQMYTPGKGNN